MLAERLSSKITLVTVVTFAPIVYLFHGPGEVHVYLPQTLITV